jgi:hypothetical protein
MYYFRSQIYKNVEKNQQFPKKKILFFNFLLNHLKSKLCHLGILKFKYETYLHKI